MHGNIKLKRRESKGREERVTKKRTSRKYGLKTSGGKKGVEEIINVIEQVNIININNNSLSVLFILHSTSALPFKKPALHKSCLVCDEMRLKMHMKTRNSPAMWRVNIAFRGKSSVFVAVVSFGSLVFIVTLNGQNEIVGNLLPFERCSIVDDFSRTNVICPIMN